MCFLGSLPSAELTGFGFGKDVEEAKRNALADLASQIEVEVQSSVESIISELTKNGKTADSEDSVKSFSKTKSELPILGYKYSVSKKKESFKKKSEEKYIYEGKAVLDYEVSAPLYDARLKDLKIGIEKNYKSLLNAKKTSEKEIVLSSLLSDIIQFNKIKIICVFLKCRNIPELIITETEIKLQLLGLENKVDSIDFAVKKIASNIDKKMIYVYPPTTRDSHEITQFAGIVKDNLSKYIKTAGEPDKAVYVMKGQYDILKDGIVLSYKLIDESFNVIKTAVIKLQPEAYSGMEINPKNIEFDRVLHDTGTAVSDFRLDVSTNKGKTDLLFKKKDIVEIFVKLNKPGFIYAVGYVNKNGDKYCYLMEMFADVTPEKRKFIRRIDGDDANKWLNIGAYEISKPYGLESLQFIASSADLIERLPSYRYDKENGYYIISKDAFKGVSEVRGLKIISNKEVKSCESVIMFTTME